MGQIHSKKPNIIEPKKIDNYTNTWCMLNESKVLFSIFQTQTGKFKIYHFDYSTTNIKYIELTSDNTLVIGIHNYLFDKYGKHTFIKRKNGEIIWEFPYIETPFNAYEIPNMQYKFSLIERKQNFKITSSSTTTSFPEFIQPLIDFFSPEWIPKKEEFI